MTILREVVASHLNSKCRHVFAGMDAVEAQLRKRCLRDRLCRTAQEKYHDAVMQDSKTWLYYLRGSRGKAHIEKWVDRKIEEAAAKWTRIGSV